MISVLLAFSGPDDPPAKCFRTNANGDLPTCTYAGGEWTRSYPSGFGPSGAGGGGFEGLLVLLFVVAVVLGVAGTIWRVTTAQRMAREAGMSERDATAMTLLSDDGFEATYLASNLRGRPTTPDPGTDPGPLDGRPAARARQAARRGAGQRRGAREGEAGDPRGAVAARSPQPGAFRPVGPRV